MRGRANANKAAPHADASWVTCAGVSAAAATGPRGGPSATISKGGFDDSAGGLDEPAFAVDGLAVEPRDEPISDQRRREGAEIRRRHVAHRVSAVGINNQLARARHGTNHSLGVLERA